MSGSSDRIDWIDTLKGIGIIFVVIGHGYSGAHPKMLAYIFSFHMPLFFFVAGYLFQNRPYAEFGPFFLRKLQTRIVPYVMFSLTYFGACLIQCSRDTGLSIASIFLMEGREKMTALLFADRTVLEKIGNVALWFLPSLFIAENIVFLVRRFARKMPAVLPIGLAALSLVAYEESVSKYLGLHATAITALTAAVFYGCGSMTKAAFFQEGMLPGIRKNKTLFLLMAASISIAFSLVNGRVDLSMNSYGNYFLFYGAAFSGIGCFALIAHFISPSSWLAFFGKNSIVILCLHLSLAQVAPVLCETVFINLGAAEYLRGPRDFSHVLAEAAFLDFLTLVMLIPCIYAINEFIPVVIGRQKQRIAEAV